MTDARTAPSHRHRRWLSRIALLLLLCGTLACDADSDVFTDIGTARLFFVESDLLLGSVLEPEEPLQVAEWTVTEATLEAQGMTFDLLFGGPCEVIDTAFVVPVINPQLFDPLNPSSPTGCARSLVLEADMELEAWNLALTFTMQVRRAAPPPGLEPDADYDGDGVDNGVDNCVLIHNPPEDCDNDPGTEDEQCDRNDDGFGDACTLLDLITGQEFLDSDGDQVPDIQDNCVWEENVDQADTMGVSTMDAIFGDGIGDACVEEVATVQVMGDPQIQLNLSSDVMLSVRQAGVLTVDFQLDCNWVGGVCELDPDAVRLCLTSGTIAASLGCP